MNNPFTFHSLNWFLYRLKTAIEQNRALLTNGNSKLGHEIYNFIIPRSSCKDKTEHCERYCYGKKGNYSFPSNMARSLTNLKWTMTTKFVEQIDSQVKYLTSLGLQLVRLHATGDFYSDTYYKKWVEIAKRNPATTFLAYTRNPRIDLTIAPSNFKIRFSVDPTTKRFNPTAQQFAYVVYDKEHGIENHLSKYENNGIVGRICNSKCKQCNFCFQSKQTVIFPARGVNTSKL